MTADQLDLDAIQARVDALTEGPWWLTEANAEFTAAARTDVPLLLDEVKRLRCAGDHVFPSGLNRTEIHEQFGCECLVRADEAEQQRDAAVAALAEVRALIAEAGREPRSDGWRYIVRITAALDASTPGAPC